MAQHTVHLIIRQYNAANFSGYFCSIANQVLAKQLPKQESYDKELVNTVIANVMLELRQAAERELRQNAEAI